MEWLELLYKAAKAKENSLALNIAQGVNASNGESSWADWQQKKLTNS